ncbi:glycosyl hydrolase [Roseisolibacter sp. H3M3-2]|uniref:glycoside hydrolase family 26 protein n=1 Tax=Roseisolibacter sp. H3M3-2 TaxID=3031323 RepID=UPI0023DA67A0|nr:glycosyl hydrolase [Roseisolibacter sp. H3M3-2]MDF1504146.1 glycosyl hydrolase [Roseisolibacter sp. H3M3-2]
MRRLLLSLLTLGACAPDAALAPRARPSAAALPAAAGVETGVAIESAPLGKPGLTAWDQWTQRNGGRRPLYVMWFADWSSGFQGYAVDNARSRGAVPVVTWEMKNGRRAISHADVLAGKWDAYVDTWGRAAAAKGGRLVLRFGHEMNGDWYGWSGAANGANAQAAERFRQVWRRVRARLHAAGATNVEMAWCPNHESVPAAAWNTPTAYYPGAGQVEWLCMDGYNWGTSQTLAADGWTSAWKTFDQVFRGVYDEIAALDPAPPVMIGEFASSELGGSKPAWIAHAATRMTDGSYPRLRAFIWFNYDKETDWRVESTTASLDAFRTAFAAPGFAWR